MTEQIILPEVLYFGDQAVIDLLYPRLQSEKRSYCRMLFVRRLRKTAWKSDGGREHQSLYEIEAELLLCYEVDTCRRCMPARQEA